MDNKGDGSIYYSIYANEQLALDNWDYYNECNWLLVNLLAKDYERKDEYEMTEFYFNHRHERLNEDGYYASNVITFTSKDMLEMESIYNDYMTKKYYHEEYMEDLYESGLDSTEYTNPYLPYIEWNPNEYLDRLGRFFNDKQLMKRVKSGEDITFNTYEWLIDNSAEMSDKFIKKINRNKKLKIKLREVNEVILYKSDFDAIEKAKRECKLTELQIQLCFGLIFMSRMNDVRWCRIGTTYKSKGFYSSFDKHISDEDRQAVMSTGLFEDYINIKGKARGQLRQKYDYEKMEYLHIEDEIDKVYLNYDNKDEVAWVFKTTVENNRLNFSRLCKEALPNLKNKYCTVCGKEFTPNNNKQKQCTECKEKYAKENARLRKQRQRKREKGLLPKAEKKKKLNKAEREKLEKQRQHIEDTKYNDKLATESKEKPWLY